MEDMEPTVQQIIQYNVAEVSKPDMRIVYHRLFGSSFYFRISSSFFFTESKSIITPDFSSMQSKIASQAFSVLKNALSFKGFKIFHASTRFTAFQAIFKKNY